MHPKDMKDEEKLESSGSRHAALDQLTAQVEERYREQQTRNNERKTKSQVEKEHAQYLRSRYGGSTSQQPLLGQDFSSQSNQHGRNTIGLDARVNLGRSVLGTSPSTSSTSLDSTPRPATNRTIHHTALSIVERLWQTNTNSKKPETMVVASNVKSNSPTSGDKSNSPTSGDKSNSATSGDRTDSTTSGKKTNSSTSGDKSNSLTSGPDASQTSQRCPVMNCEVGVRSRGELDEHMEEQHSPCNPCRHLYRGRLERALDEYVCPVCLRRFKSHKLCLEHMVAADHKALMNPLAIAAYACPQCLLLFPTSILCAQHIQEAKHNSYAYAFKDDEGRSKGLPVPMPASVVEEFVYHCKRLPWTLECITCEKKIDTTIRGGKTQIGQHLRQEHTLMATTDLTPGEVFGLYMIKGYTCIQCLRLFDALPGGKSNAIHECRKGVLGMYVESPSDCLSFEQYIIRYGLGHIIEPAGPSSRRNNISSSGELLAPQPTEGGIYMPPSSSNTLCSKDSALLSPTRSTSGPFHVLDIRKSGPVPLTTNQYDSDTILSHSVSSSALLAKPKHTRSSDCAKSLNPVKHSKSSVLDSNDNEVSDYIPPTASSSNGSRGSSTDSFVTAVSHPGKRCCSPSIDNGPPMKRQRHVSNTSSDGSIEEITITSSMENLSMSLLDGKTVEKGAEKSLSKNQLRRRNKKIKRQMKKERAAKRAQIGSDSSQSNDEWLKIDLQHNKGPQGLFSPKKKVKTTKHGSFFRPGPSTGEILSSDMEINLLFSDDGGKRRKERQVKLLPVRSNLSRPDHSPTVACQTGESLRALSPNKSIQTSSSILGVDTSAGPSLLSPAPNIPDGLHTMRQIVFLDLDNWGGFWTKLPCCLPDRTFVWGFYGGATSWMEPKSTEFLHAKSHGLWHIHKKCSNRKDAADFAICLMVGKLDERLPKHIPFTILSGDHGFLELENQMRGSERRAAVINPHHRSNSEVYTLICSVGEV